MRSLLLWALGVALAFFVTAGAFLLLAELGSRPLERSLTPNVRQGTTGSPLLLNIGEEQLRSLQRERGQPLTIGVRNHGESRLSDISLTLRVASENTAAPEIRFYRGTLDELSPGEYSTLGFELNLSPFAPPGERGSPAPGSLSRVIIEVRATVPEGDSAIRTVILPP